MNQNPPTATTTSAHARFAASLPFADTADFADVDRGFLGALEPGTVTGRRRPGGVGQRQLRVPGRRCRRRRCNPSLWRQSTLVARQGLYEVVEGIYQVRGLDLSNMTFVEGDTRRDRDRPADLDRDRGRRAGALPRSTGATGRWSRSSTRTATSTTSAASSGSPPRPTSTPGTIQVIAPEGFIEHAVEENVYAGTAMARRAGYMYGAALARGPQGQVGAGLGQTTSAGEVGLIVPTLDITDDRRRRTPWTASRSSSRWRRAPRRPRRCTSTSRATGRCAWPRTPRTPCTTCSPCAARWSATRTSGRRT